MVNILLATFKTIYKIETPVTKRKIQLKKSIKKCSKIAYLISPNLKFGKRIH